MISAVQQGDIYTLHFKYDPNFIALVKSVPGRQWHPDKKIWTIPSAHLGWLLKAVEGTPYKQILQVVSEEHLNENATIDSTEDIPNVDISDIDQYVMAGSTLYEHQKDFLRYAKSKGRRGFILADDMGCIAGDAIITGRHNSANMIISLAHLYRRFHNPNNKKSVYSVRCCDPESNVITYEMILDVVQSGIKAVYTLELENGESIRLTADHEVLTQRGFVPAKDLRFDDSRTEEPDMVCIDGFQKCRYCKVLRLIYAGDEMTYDIKLVGPYHNFVANGLFVHNCGKTLEIINYALYQRKRYGYKHCFIITCINAAKYAWQEDIYKHTNGEEQAYILGSRKIKKGRRKGQIRYNGAGADKVDDLTSEHMYADLNEPELPFFIIVNVEAIGRTKLGKKQYILADAIIKKVNNGTVPMIAIDECHKNMSPTSTQGKILLYIKKKTERNAQWIPMTGTPIRNKPTDVYTPLKLVDGHSFPSYYAWSNEFCVFGGYGGYEIQAYKNIPMLKKLLQGNMIRRTTDEVLDLPPRIYYTEYIENTKYQIELAEALTEEMEESRDEIMNSVNPLTAFLRLRQVNGSPELIDESLRVDDKYPARNAKLERLMELVEDAVARDEKVVVFSNWSTPLQTIYKFLREKYKVCCYIGNMSEAQREQHKRVFINNPDYKVMLGTIGAMGASLTLTVATNIIFYDECWTPSDKEQAIKRCNRIGSTKPLKVFSLISKDTVDERVHQIMETKEYVAKFIVDDQLDLKHNPWLFDYLLGTGEPKF